METTIWGLGFRVYLRETTLGLVKRVQSSSYELREASMLIWPAA